MNYIIDRLGTLHVDRGFALLTLGATTAATALIGTYYLMTSHKKYHQLMSGDLDVQSIELEDGSRTSLLAKDGLIEFLHEDVQTLYEAFKRGLRVSNNGPCLGSRSGPEQPFDEWLSYQEVSDRAHAFGSGLVAHQSEIGQKTFIGIYAQNSPKWMIVSQACNMYSMITVPLYDTLGSDACVYIINQAEISTVICDRPDKVESLLKTAAKTPSLKRIIVIEYNSVSEGLKKQAATHDVEILEFSVVEKDGRGNLIDHLPPSKDDLASICYTSGTTGDPKGVMLTHKNIISNASGVFLSGGMDITPQDSHLSYLPLAHMFERTVQEGIFMQGGKIGYFQGDIKLLVDDLKALKPTVFPTVPRLLNRMYDKVLAGVSGSRIKMTLFKMAMNSKKKELKKGIVRKNSIWDRLIFKKVQQGLGGRVRAVITGSAPVSDVVLTFCRCAFGCPVYEGYGQTEANAGITFTLAGESTTGPVGPPCPCNYVKLVDVPDMEYFAKDGKGEVCAKGHNVMKGYLKQPEKTAETIDQDGWLHTGDIGEWMPNGTLKIIDRKKNIFKLAQGEYIAPEKIENVYVRSSLVAQAFVDGDSLKPCVVGVIVPDPETLPSWAKNNNIPGKTMDEFCQNQNVKNVILKDIIDKGKEFGLKSFEQVKDVVLFPELFSVENEMLTPTFKSKRPYLRKFFAKDIDNMYDNMAV